VIKAKNNTEYIEFVYNFFNKYVDLSMAEFQQMAPYFEFREFKKKENVLDFEEVEDYFNMICKGLVRKYIIIGKKEVTLQLSTEGHFIHSELSFFYHTPSKVIIETIEPSLMISVTKENMEKLYSIHPKIERLGRLLVNDMFIKKDFRNYSQLKYSTSERFLNYMQNHSDMLQRVPQKYLASYLNIKPETFSRLKHLLRKKPVKD